MSEFKTRAYVYISYTDETSVDNLAELVALSDVATRHLTKVFADQFPVQDAIIYGYDLPRSLADSMSSADQAALSVSKPVGADTFGFSDGATLAAGKAASDSSVLSDAVAWSYGKALAETISMSDAFVLSVSGVKGDTFSFTDGISLAPNKEVSDTLPGFTDVVDILPGTQFGESVGSTDSISFSVGLAFGDEILLTDQYDLDYTNGRSFSDSTGFAVEFTFASTKSLTESIALAETGLLRMQDYAAQDYFAEDYVVSTTRFW